MNKDLSISAIAGMEGDALADALEVKKGSGVIKLLFTTEKPLKDDLYGEEQYYVGDIDVYSDGTISASCADSRYLKDINGLYSKLHGPNAGQIQNDKLLMPVISKEKDPARFTRVKEFIKEAGIELEYGEDQAFEAEEDYRNGIARL